MEQQNNKKDPWQCEVCREVFVVQSLARCCEMKHAGVVFVRQPYVPRKNQKPLKQNPDSEPS